MNRHVENDFSTFVLFASRHLKPSNECDSIHLKSKNYTFYRIFIDFSATKIDFFRLKRIETLVNLAAQLFP